MSKKLQAPRGTRDFYPEDQRLQNWLFDQWRSRTAAVSSPARLIPVPG